MSTVKTGNQNHDDKVNGAEAVRQAAVVPTAAKATVVTAEATFVRAAAVSAATNNCGIVPYMTWLAENGKSLYP